MFRPTPSCTRVLVLGLLLLLVGATAAAALTPAHIWSQRFGSTSTDQANALAIDASGNIIIAGSFAGTVNFGGSDLISAGGSDIFIAKYNSAGVHQWSERFGSTGSDVALGVAVDLSGNVIITGDFFGTVDFGSGVGIVGPGGTDIFLAKYNSAGTHQWSKGYGGTASDIGMAVAVNSAGEVYVTGTYTGNATLGNGGLTIGLGGTDIFLEKYNSAGGNVWSQAFGSAGNDTGSSVAVDGAGNVLATGNFFNTVNFGGGGLVSAGQDDIYLVKYNSAGAHQWSKRFGSTSSDAGKDVAADASGNILMTGLFSGTVDFGGGGLVSSAFTDIVTARYDAAGVHQWSRRIGGASSDFVSSVAFDATGHALLAAYFFGTVTFTGGSLASAGGTDMLIARYDAAGSLAWIQRFGAGNNEQARAIAADASGNAIVTGTFGDTVDFGGSPLLSAGGLDVALAKYSADPREAQITSITDLGNDQGRQVAIHFLRSAHDQTGSTRTLLKYEAYRREKAPPALVAGVPGSRGARGGGNPAGLSRGELLAAGWTEVGTVDAHGETSYSMVVPTIGDSTLTLGQYYSSFYVRSSTNDPLVFFDSPIDSGYSVDNLAPGVPSSFVYSTGQLTWNESTAKDFDYFTVYGSNTNSFGAATLVNYSVAPAMNVVASPYLYYFVTATDFSGNEGKPASVHALTGVGETPRSYVLSVSNYPNPFNPRTTVSYTVPSRGAVTVAIYDAHGAHVVTLFKGERAAGAYSVNWDGRTDNAAVAASGVYFARIEHSSGTRTKKMVLLK